jgi:photosystem II stability/assembly factor-like uncharacterized protein
MAGSSGRWERLADRPGGDVAGLAMAPTDGGLTIFAATAVGVYRSVNGGRTWALPASGSSVPFAEVVAPSPRFAQDRTIFVCAGDGLYRSTDGGESWVPVLIGSRMLSLAIAPGDGPEGLVVLAGTDTDGVLRSDDGGRTWTGANAGLLDLTLIALALSPAFVSDRLGFAGTASGLYRTRNGARSWREVETGLDDPAVQCLAVSPNFAEDRLVLAGTEAHGLLRSDDGGATWHRPPAMADHSVTALAFSSQSATGADRAHTIAAATESGIAISHDGGETWHITSPEPAEVLSLMCLVEDGGEVLLAGLHRRGIVRSRDGGATWTPSDDGLSARLLVGLTLSPAFDQDQTLFIAGLQDGVCVSDDGGRAWAECSGWLDDSAALGLAISPNYAQDRTLFAATPGGVRVSRDAGATWHQTTAAAAPVRAVATTAAADNSLPLVLAALSDGVLLFSHDAATTWHADKTDFGGAEIVSLALSPDYARDRTIFVATTSASESVLWRSTNGGQRWHRWLDEPGRSDTLPLALSPNYAFDELIFVGLGARVLRPLQHAREVRSGKRRPVWRGADLGGGALAVTALAISPSYAEERTLFAATNAGVFVSRDGGDTFQSWSGGLTAPRTIALAISPSYATDRLVYGLGLGGIVWRRRDK